MKKTIVAIMILLFVVSCAGIGVKISDDALSILQETALSTTGYLIVKNNPQYRDPMVQWYTGWKQLENLPALQIAFKNGLENLSLAVSKDPFLTMQIRNAIGLLEINVEGPQTVPDIGKYQKIVDSFMKGVMAVPYNL